MVLLCSGTANTLQKHHMIKIYNRERKMNLLFVDNSKKLEKYQEINNTDINNNINNINIIKTDNSLNKFGDKEDKKFEK